MKSEVKTVPLADLILDSELYPRHNVDDANVASLVNALEAGCQLPPLVADKKSKKVVDGWHRHRAHKRVYGPTATVDVELIDYKSEADMVYDAIRRNAQHGRKLDSIDVTRSITMLQNRGIEIVKIAAALNITQKKVERLQIKVATSRTEGKATVPGTKTITVKRSCAHLAGRSLNKNQVKAHDSAPGTSYLLVCRQLREGLTCELINLEDEKLLTELRLLAEALEEHLHEREEVEVKG